MTQQTKRFLMRDWSYRIHVTTALIVAAWLLMLAVSGVLINHQESLGLSDIEVSDSYLPDYYRADARTGATSLIVLITDVHSGRIFGGAGYLIGDAIALLIVISIIAGVVSHRAKKQLVAGSVARANRHAHPHRSKPAHGHAGHKAPHVPGHLRKPRPAPGTVPAPPVPSAVAPELAQPGMARSQELH